MALQATEAGDSSCPFEGCETGKTSLLRIVDPDAPLLVGGPYILQGGDWELTVNSPRRPGPSASVQLSPLDRSG